MNTHNPSRNNLVGFTWLQLLVVCVIGIALGGIVIVALITGGGSGDPKQTLVTLQNTMLKLEEYKIEHNGIYPVGEDGSSAVLYRALSGDESGLGKPPTGPVYWKELNKARNPGLVGELNGRRVIVDGFGNSLRYHSALDKNRRPVGELHNKEDFDLWSTGPDGEPSDMSLPGTFESEETEDDIWPN